MIGYPFIQDLFASIFAESKIIDGRFFIGPQWAKELNNLNIDECIANALPGKQKYPVALLMPPIQKGHFQYVDQQSKSNIEIGLLLVTPAYYTGQNVVSQPAQNNISTHTVLQTWHDMARVGKDFLRVLDQVIMKAGYQNTICISDKSVQEIIPVTEIGTDKCSGVLLRFPIQLSLTCEVEDYADTYLDDIVPPDATDSHPLHEDI